MSTQVGDESIQVSALPPGYAALVPLRPEHRVRPVQRLPAAMLQVNAMPVTLAEFGLAAADWPIVFVPREEGEDAPAVASIALGLRTGENLALDAQGQWRPELYAPDYLRRYPFVLAQREDSPDQRVACVEPGVLGDDGLPLVETDGQWSPQWRATWQWLQANEDDMARTAAFAARLQRLGLLEPLSIDLQLGDQHLHLGGMKQISETGFAALPEAELRAMITSGGMLAAYQHLVSLGRFDALARLHARRHGH